MWVGMGESRWVWVSVGGCLVLVFNPWGPGGCLASSISPYVVMCFKFSSLLFELARLLSQFDDSII